MNPGCSRKSPPLHIALRFSSLHDIPISKNIPSVGLGTCSAPAFSFEMHSDYYREARDAGLCIVGLSRLGRMTVWCRLGVALDGRLGGGHDRLAGYRIHRSGGDRRTLWPVAQSHLARRRSDPAHRRGHRLLPARGTDSDRHRPVRTRLFAVAWAAVLLSTMR